jgi:hypothetical protein
MSQIKWPLQLHPSFQSEFDLTECRRKLRLDPAACGAISYVLFLMMGELGNQRTTALTFCATALTIIQLLLHCPPSFPLYRKDRLSQWKKHLPRDRGTSRIISLAYSTWLVGP